MVLDINGKLAQCGQTLYCEDERVNEVSDKDTRGILLISRINCKLAFFPFYPGF